jgi:hypothetical protein
METTDPQFLYLALILPSLFGLTLVGEGLNKILKDENQGLVSLVIGLLFMCLVIFVYIFLSASFS